jgi:hypothetical protein
MICARLSFWSAAFGLMLLASVPVTHATSIIAPDFDHMVGDADYIVRAVVKSVTPEWRDNPDQPGQRYIATLVELEVKQVIKGTPPSPLVLDVVGGRIGDKELTIDGAPRFTVGQESILFVKGNGRQIIPLVGMKHGHYPLRHDKQTGQDQMTDSNGQPLYSEKDIGHPASSTTPSSAREPDARPLSPDEFAARIRKSPKFLHRDDLN